MALVRAKSFGVDPQGGKVHVGKQFEHEGPLASWMELVEGGDLSPAPPTMAAEPNEQSEAAADAPPAESGKRDLRRRKKEAE